MEFGQEKKSRATIQRLPLTGPCGDGLPSPAALCCQTLFSAFLLFLASLLPEAEVREIQFSGHLLSRILVHIHPSVRPLLNPRPVDFLRRSLHPQRIKTFE